MSKPLGSGLGGSTATYLAYKFCQKESHFLNFIAFIVFPQKVAKKYKEAKDDMPVMWQVLGRLGKAGSPTIGDSGEPQSSLAN